MCACASLVTFIHSGIHCCYWLSFSYQVSQATGSDTDVSEGELSSRMSDLSSSEGLSNGLQSATGDASDWLSDVPATQLEFDTKDDGVCLIFSLFFDDKEYCLNISTVIVYAIVYVTVYYPHVIRQPPVYASHLP